MPSLADMFPNLAKLKKEEASRPAELARLDEPPTPEPASDALRSSRAEPADAAPRERSLRLPAPRLSSRSSAEPTLKVSGPTRARRASRGSRVDGDVEDDADQDARVLPQSQDPTFESHEPQPQSQEPTFESQSQSLSAQSSHQLAELRPYGGAAPTTREAQVASQTLPGATSEAVVSGVEPELDSDSDLASQSRADDAASLHEGERRSVGERRSGEEPRSGRERRFGLEARSGGDRRSGADPRSEGEPRSGQDRRQKTQESAGFSPLASAARFGISKVSGRKRGAGQSGVAAAATVASPKLEEPAGEVKQKRRSKPSRSSPDSASNISRLRSVGSIKNVNIGMPRRGGKGSTLVGLDIQPGYVAAVEADVNGVVAVKRALGIALPPETMREGDLLDPELLTEALRELFGRARLDKRVRIGLANQRVVVRTIELPPIEDRKELVAAVNFSAQDQIPMPLANAVLDFQPLGIVETPAGRRQRVVVVAAQREMVERLVSAVSSAGLRPEAVDLSAFAMIRALHRPDDEARTGGATPTTEPGAGVEDAGSPAPPRGQTLFLNVGGLTNLAIADGTTCRFTRAVGGGLESMASSLAERRSIALVDARAAISSFDLAKREPRHAGLPGDANVATALPATTSAGGTAATRDGGGPEGVVLPTSGVGPVQGGPAPQPSTADAEVRAVIAGGLREIAGEVRNSLEYHRAQESSGAVDRVVVSGSALEINGFASALEVELGFRLERRSVASARGGDLNGTPAERLAVAAGLAVEEVGS